ncbi:MAG: hypothetical protein CMJ34_11170 [Phycisphaerae bacterium]|nr:hypothetical protein [Phycisphaerae bacterium]
MSTLGVRAWLASPPGRGGIAVIDLEGEAKPLEKLLGSLAPGAPVAPGEAVHRRIADIDDGMVLRPGSCHAQLMPHGGIAIVRRIAEALQQAGASWSPAPPPGARFEARDRVEALALDTISIALSPAAIGPLLRQSRAWRDASGPLDAEDLARGRRLDRMVRPASIACVGSPNAGKSSLLNALLAIDAAIVTDRPGTTRDRVSRHLDLAGVVVEWIDTPGLRRTDDPIEERAIEASLEAIREATLVVRLLAPDVPDPELPDDLSPEEGILDVRSKIDLQPESAPGISAVTGEGIPELAMELRDRIVRPEDLSSNGRWCFCDELRPESGPGNQSPTLAKPEST